MMTSASSGTTSHAMRSTIWRASSDNASRDGVAPVLALIAAPARSTTASVAFAATDDAVVDVAGDALDVAAAARPAAAASASAASSILFVMRPVSASDV